MVYHRATLFKPADGSPRMLRLGIYGDDDYPEMLAELLVGQHGEPPMLNVVFLDPDRYITPPRITYPADAVAAIRDESGDRIPYYVEPDVLAAILALPVRDDQAPPPRETAVPPCSSTPPPLHRLPGTVPIPIPPPPNRDHPLPRNRLACGDPVGNHFHFDPLGVGHDDYRDLEAGIGAEHTQGRALAQCCNRASSGSIWWLSRDTEDCCMRIAYACCSTSNTSARYHL